MQSPDFSSWKMLGVDALLLKKLKSEGRERGTVLL